MLMNWSTRKKNIAVSATMAKTRPVVTMRLLAGGPGDAGHLRPHLTHEFRRIERHVCCSPGVELGGL